MLCVEVGDKLAMARRYHAPALTQEDLARILGVDTSTVGRWESKDHIPPDRLPQIAALLNVKEAWFFNGDDTPPTTARRVPMQEPSNVKPIDPHRAL
jgi:transcriptional regulator with XRE-family HTH domain